MLPTETMELTVVHEGGVRFAVKTRRHIVVTDQPVDDGGDDAGPSPVELFVGSLASCIAYFVARFCARHGLAYEGMAVSAEWSMAQRPHRVGSMTIRVHLPGSVTDSQRERLVRVAEGCTVHRSLITMPAVAIELDTSGAAA